MSESNKKLIALGANALSVEIFEDTITTLFNESVGVKKPNKLLSLFDDVGEEKNSQEDIQTNELVMNNQISFFEFFITKLHQEYPISSIFKPKELEEKFRIKLSQINTWLPEAEKKEFIKRLEGRIKKYQII